MEMMNVCPVVVISHRPGTLAEIKWEPSQCPAAWPLHHLPPKPPPPMANKGTMGRGETAEKTRRTRVQPLNTDVTVKGPENLRSLLEWYICLAASGSVHTQRGNAHIYAEANIDTCGQAYIDYKLCWSTRTHTYGNINTLSESAVCSCTRLHAEWWLFLR